MWLNWSPSIHSNAMRKEQQLDKQTEKMDPPGSVVVREMLARCTSQLLRVQPVRMQVVPYPTYPAYVAFS